MGTLRRAFGRCVEWIWDWFWAPELVLHDLAPAAAPALRALTDPASRIHTQLLVRQETPPGIARLAALLSACVYEPAHEPTVVPADGGLAGPAAGNS